MHRLFDGLLLGAPLLGAGLDWKTSLQELTAAGEPRRAGVPDRRGRARTTSRCSPPPRWSAGRELGSGEGRTKKEAEQKAAELAWRTLTAEAARRRRPAS